MFKFDFALDDADLDLDLSSQLSNTHIVSPTATKLSVEIPEKINEDPCAEISIDRLLAGLPTVLSYSPLVVPILKTDAVTPTFPQSVTLVRRDLFDARFQLIAQENTDDDTTNEASTSSALAFVEAPSDLVPGVYEGGLKTWECSVDLAGYLAGLQDKFNARGKRVIEIGCGTAIPSMFVLQQLFSTPPPEDTVYTEIHLQDYNSSVLELVSFPNLLLTWYTSFAATSFRASHPPPEMEDDIDPATLEANFTALGNLFPTPELKAAFLSSLQAYKIHLRFFSGSWNSFPIAPYDTVLSSETIYRSESIASLLVLLKGVFQALDRESQQEHKHMCLVAAKVLYFGVGGGIGEFVNRIKDEGGEVVNVWEIRAGVGRRIMLVHWGS